jgi:phosphoglycolate phosphatase-like HAD superfamily hydrolase
VQISRSTLIKEHKARKLWFSDAVQFLEEMGKKFPLALVTGSRQMFVNEIFDKKTKKFLRFIITSDDVVHKKPDIEPLSSAIKKLKIKKEEVVFIGDSVQDGLMCRRLGVKFIAKITGISTENQLRALKPLFIAKNFEEVKRFIGWAQYTG